MRFLHLFVLFSQFIRQLIEQIKRIGILNRAQAYIIFIQIASDQMDEFDEVYLSRHTHFSQGRVQGTNEANAYQLADVIEEGRQFGTEFGRELAMYESYLAVFQQLSVGQSIGNSKIVQLAQQIQTLLDVFDYSSLEQLKSYREVLSKKFKIFSAMLGLKGTKDEMRKITKETGGFQF